MTAKREFDEAEWDLIAEGPVTAGMIVLTAEGGGSFRETLALSKAYAEARKQHGESELLDEIVSNKPEFNRHRFGSTTELHDGGLARIGEAIALLEQRATPAEVADYREFVVTLATRVAEAHKEHGQAVSPAEQRALDDLRAHLAGAGAA